MMPISPTKGMEEAFDTYADGYDNVGDEWQDMGVDQHYYAGYLAGVGQSSSVDEDLLRQWADDFTEAAKHMPTRLQSVVLLTRAEEVLALLGEGNE